MQELDAALWALEVDAEGATPAVEALVHELDGHLSYLNSILSTGASSCFHLGLQFGSGFSGAEVGSKSCGRASL